MDYDTWRSIVAHVRTELHRYYPTCDPLNIGVTMNPVVSKGLVLTVTLDEGVTEITLRQTNAQDGDAEFMSFRLPSGRTLTLPLPYAG